MTDDRLTGYATENVVPLTDDDRAELRGIVLDVVTLEEPVDLFDWAEQNVACE